jgi:signal transduction histidine kinase
MRFVPNSDLRSRLRGSISLRIGVLFCLTFTIALLTAFTLVYFELDYSLERADKEVISAKSREMQAVLAAEGLPGLQRFLANEQNKILNAPYLVRVLTPEGIEVFAKPSVQEKQFDFSSFNAKVRPETIAGWQALSAINDEDKFDFLTSPAGPKYFLQVGTSSEDREAVLGQIIQGFILAGGLLIVLGGALGVWYARKSLAPIRTMLGTIQGIESGDLSKRVSIGDSRDELRDLGETFNRMIGRIEMLIQTMRDSLDNVAHDIRTPLTRIRIVAEDALLTGTSEVQKEALADCAESATGISELVDQLLSISEAAAGTLSLRYSSCDVKQLLLEVAEIYEFVAADKEIKIEIATQNLPLSWSLDVKRVKQAIANLLDNALKFSPTGTTVCLSARSSHADLEISVSDDGPGIPESELTRIWDRLFRGDKSRSTKGLGLGLSIVRSNILAHGGSVRAENRSDGGSVFVISLPTSKA